MARRGWEVVGSKDELYVLMGDLASAGPPVPSRVEVRGEVYFPVAEFADLHDLWLISDEIYEDLIFAGAGQRQPLGRAEVTLTIDNTARLLPIDFTEVTITRTLFRNGDSVDYFAGAWTFTWVGRESPLSAGPRKRGRTARPARMPCSS